MPQYSPPAYPIEQIENREIAPYAWVNPDDEHKATLSKSGVLEHCLSTAWSIAQASAGDGLPPHPAHASADVDAHAMGCGTRWNAGCNRWPACPIEQAEQNLR